MDPESGIGRMTEAAFVKRFHDYREYETAPLPTAIQKNFTLMPWLNFSKYSAEELEAIYRYLRQQKPIDNKVTAHPDPGPPTPTIRPEFPMKALSFRCPTANQRPAAAGRRGIEPRLSA